MKKVILAFFAAVFLALGLSACNTVRGAGEDVENTGAAIRNNTPP
jgi:predicted small secreted protein